MVNIDYGYIKINLDKIMKEQNISINKLAFRAEMQRTQFFASVPSLIFLYFFISCPPVKKCLAFSKQTILFS